MSARPCIPTRSQTSVPSSDLGPAPRGQVKLEVQLVSGQNTATTTFASSPVKLLTPCARGQSVWAYTSSLGGGLVAGDQTRLELTIGAGARCFVGTQASTKVYRNPAALPCGHATHAELATDSLLVFAPDPVQAFAGSNYRQRQEWHLPESAGLVLLDWLSSGRAAGGERWAFTHIHSRNDVFVSGERAFADSVCLDASDGPINALHRTGRFDCFAMLLFIGAPLQAMASGLLAEISSRPIQSRSPLVCSASPIRDGALLRIAGEQVEGVAHELLRHLKPLSSLLGDDPWQRKW